MSKSKSKITISHVTPNNLGQLKQINTAVLPTRYNDQWYRGSLDHPGLSQLAFFNDTPVGAIRCSLVLEANSSMPSGIYIMTLAVLAPYRRYGIGSMLLDCIIDKAKEFYAKRVGLHVWILNTDAIEWYKNRDFKQFGPVIEGYYKSFSNIQPPDAVLLIREVQ